jgi:predicted MFS family arabinose efflux permease
MIEWLANLYDRLSHQLLGTTISEMMRREASAFPLVFMLIFMILGAILQKKAKHYWWLYLLVFLAGILSGHFWW